jgi:ABC-type branched-subunit amino acid transport system permease subunit
MTPVPPARSLHQYRSIGIFAAATAAVTSMLVTTEFGLSVVNQWLLYSMAAIGFYLVFCVAGRFAFCQTFMMATGAYTAAYVSREHAFWIGLIAGVVVVVIVATLFGLLVRKTEAFYFAIATLAFAQLGSAFFTRRTDLTGPSGLVTNVPLPSPLGEPLSTQQEMFWLLLPMLALCLVVATFIERSPVAREAMAARDLPELAITSGINVDRIRVVMFVVGSALGGLSGALAAYWQGSVSNESFGLALAIGIFLMPIIGGVSSMWGPVAGALLYVGLPRLLSGLDRYATLIYGVALVAAIIMLPNGIVGAFRQGRARLTRFGGPTGDLGVARLHDAEH